MSARKDCLVTARRLLVVSDARYICVALGRVARVRPMLAREAEQLQAEILDQLDGWESLEGYLIRQGLPYKQAPAARLAWLDKLIEGSK